MAKVRIYELARELDLESKDVLERAQELGIEVKTASSGLDEDGVALVKLSYEDQADPSADAAEAAAPDASVSTPEVAVDEDADEDAGEVITADASPAEAGPVEADTDVAEVPAPPAAADEAETAADVPGDGEDKVLLVEPGITVHELARMVKIRTAEIVRTLMFMGEMVPGGGQIPTQAIEPLGRELGWEILVAESDEEPEEEGRQRHLVEYEDDPASLESRPPVVTVMGHVDHGKTQLLDTIRRANVIEDEAGRITQHIGAYQVDHDGSKITFIDTPGHEAFTALRARGADVTDIAIIVVAADDSVMPQTVEAISHAKAADVPMIIAINKIDLEAADPYAVRAALTQHEVVVEELGGEVPAIEISALQGTNIDDLLEMIALVAEVEELQANPRAAAIGTVIEAQLEVGRGPVASVIVQRGMLKKGDAIVAGPVAGRVRAMFDDSGTEVRQAGPSSPVLVMGWDDVPTAGDMFEVVKNERTARKMAEVTSGEIRAAELTVPSATDRLGMLIEQLRTQDHSELRVIVKTDTHGSLEAIKESVGKISRDDGYVTIVHSGVGGITANDVSLAEASGAIIYGFNARPDASARSAAKEAGIDIRTFSIIYELLDDIELLLVGELAPEEIENFLGVAEVRQVFRAPRLGAVAGSYVTEGSINRNARARLVRDGVVVYDGTIVSLRRFKDDVQTVATGYECGIGLANFRDIKEGDTIESYEVREVART
ncbi:MAG: translation initiation factor IF-2 [Acidimicrobiia bacterium]|nr:translation initiation factor IF-2 [Acidimicrobiia bacterium]